MGKYLDLIISKEPEVTKQAEEPKQDIEIPKSSGKYLDAILNPESTKQSKESVDDFLKSLQKKEQQKTKRIEKKQQEEIAKSNLNIQPQLPATDTPSYTDVKRIGKKMVRSLGLAVRDMQGAVLAKNEEARVNSDQEASNEIMQGYSPPSSIEFAAQGLKGQQLQDALIKHRNQYLISVMDQEALPSNYPEVNDAIDRFTEVHGKKPTNADVHEFRIQAIKKHWTERSLLMREYIKQYPDPTPESAGLWENALTALPRFIGPMILSGMNPAAGLFMTYQQIKGGSYVDYRKQNIDTKTADTASTLKSMLSTPAEFAGNILHLKGIGKAWGAFSKATKVPQKVSNFVQGMLFGAIGEGIEEWIQQHTDAIADIYAANPDLSEDELIRFTWETWLSPEFQKNAREAGLTGGAAGLLLPGASGLTRSGLTAAQFATLKAAEYRAQKRKSGGDEFKLTLDEKDAQSPASVEREEGVVQGEEETLDKQSTENIEQPKKTKRTPTPITKTGITKAERKALQEKGFTEEFIDAMRPQDVKATLETPIIDEIENIDELQKGIEQTKEELKEKRKITKAELKKKKKATPDLTKRGITKEREEGGVAGKKWKEAVNVFVNYMRDNPNATDEQITKETGLSPYEIEQLRPNLKPEHLEKSKEKPPKPQNKEISVKPIAEPKKKEWGSKVPVRTSNKKTTKLPKDVVLPQYNRPEGGKRLRYWEKPIEELSKKQLDREINVLVNYPDSPRAKKRVNELIALRDKQEIEAKLEQQSDEGISAHIMRREEKQKAIGEQLKKNPLTPKQVAQLTALGKRARGGAERLARQAGSYSGNDLINEAYIRTAYDISKDPTIKLTTSRFFGHMKVFLREDQKLTAPGGQNVKAISLPEDQQAADKILSTGKVDRDIAAEVDEEVKLSEKAKALIKRRSPEGFREKQLKQAAEQTRITEEEKAKFLSGKLKDQDVIQKNAERVIKKLQEEREALAKIEEGKLAGELVINPATNIVTRVKPVHERMKKPAKFEDRFPKELSDRTLRKKVNIIKQYEGAWEDRVDAIQNEINDIRKAGQEIPETVKDEFKEAVIQLNEWSQTRRKAEGLKPVAIKETREIITELKKEKGESIPEGELLAEQAGKELDTEIIYRRTLKTAEGTKGNIHRFTISSGPHSGLSFNVVSNEPVASDIIRVAEKAMSDREEAAKQKNEVPQPIKTKEDIRKEWEQERDEQLVTIPPELLKQKEKSKTIPLVSGTSFTQDQINEAYDEAGVSKKNSYTEVTMSGEDFLNLTTSSDEKIVRIAEKVKGKTNEDLLGYPNAPLLVVDENGNVVGHDGRHRAIRYALDKKPMPVLLIGKTKNVNTDSITNLNSQQFGEKNRGFVGTVEHKEMVPVEGITFEGKSIESIPESKEEGLDWMDNEGVEPLSNEQLVEKISRRKKRTNKKNPLKKARPFIDVDSKEGKLLSKTILNERGTSPEIEKVSKTIAESTRHWTKRFQDMMQATWDWIDVEAPLIRVNAKRTALSLKTMMSRRTVYQQQGIQRARDFMNVVHSIHKKENIKLNKKQLQEKLERILFAYENDKYFVDELSREEQKRYRPAITWLEDYFEGWKQKFADRDVKVDFKVRMMNDVQKEIDNTNDLKKKWKLQERWLELQQLNFASIPIAVFANHLGKQALTGSKTQRKETEAKLNLMLNIVKKRNVLSLFNMKKSDQFKDIYFNPVEVIMAYEHRNAKDMSLLDLRDAMLEDGLLIKKGGKKPKGFETLGKDYGVLVGSHVDAVARNVFDDVRSVNNRQNWFDKAIAKTKMAAFLNPIFLPFYDVVQGVASGAYMGRTMYKMPANFIKAIKDVALKTDDYYEAVNSGLASKPFDLPFDEYLNQMDAISNSKGNAFNEYLNLYMQDIKQSKTKILGLGRLTYHASWNTAWFLDEMIRMTTYNALKTKGLTSEEAAQAAAKFHGDYASVPPRTRRFLNRLFFTPTFKIVMSKMYVSTMKNAIAHPINLLTGKDKYGQALAKGALGIIAVNLGFDALMKTIGFEPEDDKLYNAGRRYMTRFKDEYGQPKKFVLTLSTPFNLLQRYSQRIAKASGSIKTLGSMGWLERVGLNDFHPVWRTILQLRRNEQFDGSPIWNEEDHLSIAAMRSALFAVRSVAKLVDEGVGIFDFLKPELEADSTILAREQVQKMNTVLQYLVDGPFSIMYAHATDPEDISIAKRLKARASRHKSSQKKYILQHGKMNETWLNNFESDIKTEMQKYKEKKANREKYMKKLRKQ